MSLENQVQNLLQGPLDTLVIVIILVLALGLGALHALQPGHGKTLVAAYLVGSRGTLMHAFLLGAIVTFTHTFSVLALGLVALYLSQHILPETVSMWLGLVASLIVVVMGIWMLAMAYHRWMSHQRGLPDDHHHGHRHGQDHHGHGHSHHHHHPSHEHEHHHDHDHSHHHPGHGHHHLHDHDPKGGSGGKVTLWSLFSLGIVGGLVPCVDAMVLLLMAISLNRVGLGLAILLAFSLGIAAVLVGVGVLMVKAKDFMSRFEAPRVWLVRMPLVSAIVITGIGILMLFQAVAKISPGRM